MGLNPVLDMTARLPKMVTCVWFSLEKAWFRQAFIFGKNLLEVLRLGRVNES